MKKIVFLLIPILFSVSCSCQNQDQKAEYEKISRFFNNYMKETFPDFTIVDGEYLFILHSGCLNCVKSATTVLLSHPEYIKGHYQAILISESTLNSFSDKILTLNKNVLCDKSNKLDRMSFGIYGIAVLKVKNKKIVASKSMTPQDFEKGVNLFFTPL
jgi:hypothetical protein